MEATLTSILGIVPLKNSAFTIGRSPNNGLFINHTTVSRHHAEIRPYGQGYGIVDLGSRSGTFVNGERLVPHTPRLLRSSDAIQVGNFPILYEEKSSAQPLGASPLAGSSAPERPLSGEVARSRSSAGNQPVLGDLTATPGFLPPSPVGPPRFSGGPVSQLPDTPYALAPTGSSPDIHRESTPPVGPARRVIAPVTPVPPFYAVPQRLPVNLAQKPLQFTAFYPRALAAESQQTFLIYAHIEATLEAVREDARRSYALLGADVQKPRLLSEGTQITVVPICQGIAFQPERVSFTWTNAWHPVALRFSAGPRWAGLVVMSEVLFLAGPLIIASLRVPLRFAEPGTQPEQGLEEVSVTRYKNIFTSYSQDDVPMVQAIRQAYKALGDDSFLDIEGLRSSQNWNGVLPRAIDRADVFQVFWSQHAAQSQLVYQECQYALHHYKYDGFVRPTYWEKPLALAPLELTRHPFIYYAFSPPPEA